MHSSTTITQEQQKAQLDQDGYVLIENALPETQRLHLLETLNGTYAALEREGRNTYPGGVGMSERLILNLHNKDEAFIDLIDHPVTFPLVSHMLQDGSYKNSEPFIVTQFSARDPRKGASPQQLHIDSRFPGPPFALMTITLWMLNDFTIESGATRLVPGSHRRAEYPQDGVRQPDELTVQAPAGSVLIYNGSAWHGGGEKLKELERWSVIISYARWWLKPAFDMTLNTPPDLYANLSPARRELFGFTSVPPGDEHVRSKMRIPASELPDRLS
ncbi:MAG TPA: phytanoyl-CoA dioxygenase family protein, partial [Vicinamibacterales bacterium]|nr:phytanoyl-CoA dioxygenase family protein [Vicinamibacterales bacterium]